MAISRDEARQSLSQVADTTERTRKLATYASVDRHLIAWGIVWALGFTTAQFLPRVSPYVWLGLVAAGIAASSAIGRRKPVKSPLARRIGLLWLSLFAYAYLWVWLLLPFIAAKGPEQTMALWRHVTVIGVTIPMFAYVVIGLWPGRFLIWVGLAVTALSLLGLVVAPGYFWLWMAVTGGGTLTGTGLFIHNRWR